MYSTVFAKNNITSNVIALGWVQTDMARRDLSFRAKEMYDEIPLKRLATAEDVAYAAIFLASDEARYLTRVTIDVNGGSYLH